MKKRKVLIDTDPGIDDGCALFSALAYDQFDVLGIMCVAGNKSLPVVVPNALRIVDFYNKDIPVLKGAHNCLSKLDCDEEQENVINTYIIGDTLVRNLLTYNYYYNDEYNNQYH